MRSTRAAALSASFLLSLGLLAGCGGDEDSSADPGSDSSQATEGATTEQRGECEAEVELSGAVKASWTGEAFVVTENRSGPVLYKAANKGNTLTVLGEDGDFPALASLATKKGNFSGGEGSFKVDDEGSGATVDATLQAGAGKSVDVVATITC